MNSVFDGEELAMLERFGFHLGEKGIVKTAAVNKDQLIDCGLGTYASPDGRVFQKTASTGDLEEDCDPMTQAEHRYVQRHMRKTSEEEFAKSLTD